MSAPSWADGPCHLQVMLQLEKKLFDYFNQEVFRDDNGTAVSPAVSCIADAPGTRVLGAVTAQEAASERPPPTPGHHSSILPLICCEASPTRPRHARRLSG